MNSEKRTSKLLGEAPPSGKTSERMDIRTIARVAKVSVSTVSRAMNRSTTLNPEMAKRVWRVIDELDYFPNTQARALVSGRSRLFGLIVPEIDNPFFLELSQKFDQIAAENGYEILVSSASYDAKQRSHSIRRMLERRVEGVAVITFGAEEALLEKLHERNVPLVFVDVAQKESERLTVNTDYRHGIRQGVQHLAALGHRHIAFISGPMTRESEQSRKAAFFSSIQECGIVSRSSWIIEGDPTVEGGVAAMERLLAAKPRPTAVMCSNDMTAIGVLHKMHRAGLRVPDDLSIIGFDDIQIAAVTIPPLTTIRLSRLELARAAVMALRFLVEASEGEVRQREFNVPTNLVVRESTAFPRGTMMHLRKTKK